MPRFLGSTLLLLVLCAAAALAGGDPKPLAGKGPLGKWVSNGLWAMRVTEVKAIPTMQAFLGLPWTRRLTPKSRERVTRLAERCYGKEWSLVLVRCEARNLSNGKAQIGVGMPRWEVRADDGAQVKFAEYPDGSGGSTMDWEDNSLIAFCMQGGFPQDERLNAGAVAAGWIPLWLPSYATARMFYFRPAGRASYFGKDESIVIDLARK